MRLNTLPAQGATLKAAIRFLQTHRYGKAVKDVLRRLSARQLVLAAVSGNGVFGHVSRYIRRKGMLCAAIPGATEGDGFFGRLPLEIATMILNDYLDDMGQHGPFTRSSPRNQALVALVLQQHVARQLGKYNLDFYDVRLLFCATGTALSGSVIPCLMGPVPFEINDLNFFSPACTGVLSMCFLCLAGSFTAAKLPDAYDSLAGIKDIWELSGVGASGQACKINVIQSSSQSACDSVLLFHSTPVFGVLDADGFWHGEPALTIARKAMTSPTQMPLTDDMRILGRSWSVLKKYTDRGFSFMTEFDVPHNCGSHWCCPCTPRTTVDAGCLDVALPLFPLPSPPTPHVSSWQLGVTSCSTNNLSNTGLSIQSPSAFRETGWAKSWLSALLPAYPMATVGTAPILPVLPPRFTNILARVDCAVLNRIRQGIESAIPAFRRRQSAVLYPDGNMFGAGRVWVRVPVTRGLHYTTSALGMETHCFVDCMRHNGPSIDFDRTSITIRRFPFDAPQDLPHWYTIVVCPQDSTGADIYPANDFINHNVHGLSEPWRGNILVFKHGTTPLKRIINMAESDGALVQCIVTRTSSPFVMNSAPSTNANVLTTIPAATRACDAFFSTAELHLELMQYFDVIGLSRYGLLCKDHTEKAVQVLRRRVRRYTCPFFPDDFGWQRFFDTLETMLSWIVGSCPTAVLSLTCDPDVPDNLNVLTTGGVEEVWGCLMLLELGYALEFSVRASWRWETTGERYMAFTHPSIPNKHITFTTSRGPHFFEVFLSAPHTGHLNAITAYEVFTFNVGLTTDQRAIGIMPINRLPPSNPFPGSVRMSRSTENWCIECGIDCPARWRTTRGLYGVGRWSWNGIDDLGREHMDMALQKMGEANILLKTTQSWQAIAVIDNSLLGLPPYRYEATDEAPVVPRTRNIDEYACLWSLPPYGPSAPPAQPHIEANSAGYDHQDFQLMDQNNDIRAHQVVYVDLDKIANDPISFEAVQALLQNPPVDVRHFQKILALHCHHLPAPAFDTIPTLFLEYHQRKEKRAKEEEVQLKMFKVEKDAKDAIEAAQIADLQVLYNEFTAAQGGMKKESDYD
ncbi:hypothetical protein C8J57DRAFT_1249900 [Mycena rebaudengoi]|nr:hypothetical protein C8J57DRAFT_1249900 [Mycena rebaudengoi]